MLAIPPRTLRAVLGSLSLLASALAVDALGSAAATAPVAADPANFHYDALPATGALDFAIDAKSPSFEFQSGPSHYRAFRLPESDRPYYVEVQSFIEGPADPSRARVFYPVVALLTDDFLVSRTTDLDALRVDLPMLERSSSPAYRLTLGVDPLHNRERYLVVFTPARPRAAHLTAPVATATALDAAPQAAHDAFLGAAPEGRLRISVRPGGTVAPAR